MYKDKYEHIFYRLYGQLDATEKKFFGRYIQHLPGDESKGYLQALEQGPNRDLPRNAENYLMGHLMRFLRSFRAVSPRVEIMNHITNAENLFLRQLPQLALVEITKAEGICLAYEFLEEELVVLSWTQKLKANLLMFDQAEAAARDVMHNLRKSQALYAQNLGSSQINFLFDNYDQQPLAAFVTALQQAQLPLTTETLTTREAIMNQLVYGKTSLILADAVAAKSCLQTAWQLLSTHQLIRLSNPLLTLEVADWLVQYGLLWQEPELLSSVALELSSTQFLSPGNDVRRQSRLARLGLLLRNINQSQVDPEMKIAQELVDQDPELFILTALTEQTEKGVSRHIRQLNQLLSSKAIIGTALMRKLLRLELLLHARQGDDIYCRSRLKSYQRKYAVNISHNAEERAELEAFRHQINGQPGQAFNPTRLHQLYFGFMLTVA
jgi:hypothetical protein